MVTVHGAFLTPEGSQPLAPGRESSSVPGVHVPRSRPPTGRSAAATPPGSIPDLMLLTGGIAALNHRLIAATPPGSIPVNGYGVCFIGPRTQCAGADAGPALRGQFGFLSRARSESSSAVSGLASGATSNAAYSARKASLRARLKRVLRQPDLLAEARPQSAFLARFCAKDAKDDRPP